LIGLLCACFAGCGGNARTTSAHVVIPGAPACYDEIPDQDPYEAVMVRARCEHPDMLVHPMAYVIRRVPAPADVARYVIDRDGRRVGCWELRGGMVATCP
jgi:hypothetical protein